MASADKQLHWAPVPKSGCWSTPIGKALMLDDLKADMLIDVVGLAEGLAKKSQDLMLEDSQCMEIETNGNLQDAASFRTPAEQSDDTVAQRDCIEVLPETVTQVDHSKCDNSAPIGKAIAGTEESEWSETDIKKLALSAMALQPGIRDPAASMNEFVEELCNHTNNDLDEISKHLCSVAQERHETDKDWAKPLVSSDECLDKDEQEKKFWDTVEQTGYAFPVQGNAGNPLAGRWSRWLAESQANKDSYKACLGRGAKALFRQQWAMQQHEKFKKVASHSTKVEHEDIIGGKFLSLGRIAWLEGGDKKGMRNACNYALACLRMDKKWSYYCEMTKDVKYRYVERGFWEKFNEAWETKQIWHTDGPQCSRAKMPHPARTSHSEGPCSAAAPLAGDAAPAASAAGSAEPAATGAAAGHKRDASGLDDLAPAPKMKKTIDLLPVAAPAAPAVPAPAVPAVPAPAVPAVPAPAVPAVPTPPAVPAPKVKGKAKAKAKVKPAPVSWVQSAKLTKQAYATTMVQAASIQGQIDGDEKWAWARSNEITNAFNDARETLAAALISNPNFHDLITSDLHAAKKAAKDEVAFEVDIKYFSETMGQHIDNLQHECKALLEQHAVRLKYAKGNS